MSVVPTNVPTISDLRGIEQRYYCVRFVLPPLYTQELFLRFKRLVRQHCTRQRSIPFYADLLHVTPHHLSALIKKISNQSVMYWIHRATIQEAKLLLKTNQLMAYEIADRLDFPSASAFSKYFKRETGMTPRMYQERMAEGARQLGEIWS